MFAYTFEVINKKQNKKKAKNEPHNKKSKWWDLNPRPYRVYYFDHTKIKSDNLTNTCVNENPPTNTFSFTHV